MQQINAITHIIEQLKMKNADVRTSTYIYLDVKSNDKDLKFKVGDHVVISIH